MKERKLSLVIQKPVKTPDINVYQYLLRRPRFNADRILCRCLSQELSFGQLKSESEKYAKALAGAGVGKGDIVPICTEPSIEAIILFFAINQLGAVSTFLNSTASAEEIELYSNSYSSKIILLSLQCMERIHRLHGQFQDLHQFHLGQEATRKSR